MVTDDLDTNLNLTPMIDVMSVIVAFLLMTAVWMQISAIQTAVETRGDSAPLAVTPPSNNRVEVHVTSQGHTIAWPPVLGSSVKAPPQVLKNKTDYDLKRLKSVFQTVVQSGAKITASVGGDDNVKYGVVAETIDAIKQGGIDEVVLATN